MLILARQVNERLVLPTVPATIAVVALRSNVVRLGIDAPAEVTVLREELLLRGAEAPSGLLAPSEADAEARLGRFKNILANRLQTIVVGLDLIRRQMGQSAVAEMQALLQSMEAEVIRLKGQLQALLSASGPPSADILAIQPG